MRRLECLQAIYEDLQDCAVVTIMGATSAELHSLGHRPNFFYLQHAMGLGSSTGLGLALCLPQQKVVVFDGDGSILMNLGSLATEVTSGVTNLVHVIWDNGGWEITGAQPAGSPFGVDLEAVARGCGFTRTATVEDLESFRRVFAEAISDAQAWAIVGKVEAGDSAYRPSKNCIWLRDRFKTSLEPPGDRSG